MSELVGHERVGPPTLFDYDRFTLPANVDLTILLGPHSSAADLPPVPELQAAFEAADIIILEAEGALYDIEVPYLNGVTQGNEEAAQVVGGWLANAPNPGWKNAVYQALYGCGARIALVDLPYGHPLSARYNELGTQCSRATGLRDFNIAVSEYLDAYGRKMKILRKRDQKILENIAPAIDATVEQYPDLQQKRAEQPLQILMIYGGDHVSLFDAMSHKSKEMEVSDFSLTADMTYATTRTSGEVYQRFLRGENLSRLDAARILLFDFLGTVYRDIGLITPDTPTKQVDALLQADIEGKTYDELKELRSRTIQQLGSVTTQGSTKPKRHI